MKILLHIITIIIFFNITNNKVFSQIISNDTQTINTIANLPKQPSIILKTNPLTPLIGPIFYTSEYRLTAEIPVRINEGMQLSLSYLGKNLLIRLLEQDTTMYGVKIKKGHFIISGVRFQFTYKRYILQKLFGKDPYGMYVAIHYSYSWAKFTIPYYNIYRQYIFAAYENYDIIGGYQFTMFNIPLAVDLFAGFGYKNNSYSVYYNNQGQQLNIPKELTPYLNIPIKIVIGFNIGYAFGMNKE